MNILRWLCCFIMLTACHANEAEQKNVSKAQNQTHTVDSFEGQTIQSRFKPPKGYVRTSVEAQSFEAYLRSFPLYPSDRKVFLYNGKAKWNQQLHAAVLDIDIGNQDLQQCADAIMRLRAEYLFENRKFDKIKFHFVNGFLADYGEWRTGKRIQVDDNRVYWKDGYVADVSRKSFNQFMKTVFIYAGTPSLEKELIPKKLATLEIGDVFIKGGSPGHAVLVVDLAEDNAGKKVFLLAQSYMPAQDIHVLKNSSNESLSPWYSVNEIDDVLITPEWRFGSYDLRSF